MAPEAIQVELRGISKRYGQVAAVAGVDLLVGRGMFFSLLGPSGCGKSTLLRVIAGFEEPDAGEVIIDGRNMRGVPPEKREIGIVFQNYALFPHMTVADNVAFGLQMRRLPAADIRVRVDRMLDLVELPDVGGRRPSQLSGGQQQRVALARALAIEPKLLLLDEPLGALDRKLRENMQLKLVELQRALGVTTIFVTHDQEEALTMSDRLAVMSAERHAIEQIGSPRDIYDNPASSHVSGFIGRANLWQEQVAVATPVGRVTTERGFHAITSRASATPTRMTLCVRPERIRMFRATEPGDGMVNTVEGFVRASVFAGGTRATMVEADIGITLEVRELNADALWRPERGDRVRLTWSEASMLALP